MVRRTVVVLIVILTMSSSGIAQAPIPPTAIYVADTGNSRIVRIEDMSESGWTAFSKSGANELGDP